VYVLEEIAKVLKEARVRKGLSQRALAKKAAVPQSHISKIENAGVDLRFSSLTEIARALDLEVALVPRKSMPAIKSIARSVPSNIDRPANVVKEFKRLQDSLRIALHEHPSVKEIAQLQRQVREMERLAAPSIDLKAFREATKVVDAFKSTNESFRQIRRVLDNLQTMRNLAIHSPPAFEMVRPAYSLEDEDNG
jgi:transcriptional regulator with XRE-family HTH domain